MAIECDGCSGKIVIPFDCTDIDTGEEYVKDQRLPMTDFKCLFAKKK